MVLYRQKRKLGGGRGLICRWIKQRKRAWKSAFSILCRCGNHWCCSRKRSFTVRGWTALRRGRNRGADVAACACRRYCRNVGGSRTGVRTPFLGRYGKPHFARRNPLRRCLLIAALISAIQAFHKNRRDDVWSPRFVCGRYKVLISEKREKTRLIEIGRFSARTKFWLLRTFCLWNLLSLWTERVLYPTYYWKKKRHAYLVVWKRRKLIMDISYFIKY